MKPQRSCDGFCCTSGVAIEIVIGAVVGKFYRPIKKSLTIRIDADVLDWLKRQGKGYQTRINAVLRSFVEAQKPRGWPAAPDVSSRPRIGLNRAKRSKGATRP